MGNILRKCHGHRGHQTARHPLAQRHDQSNQQKAVSHVNITDEDFHVVVLGTGAGATHVYSQQPSSSFVVFKEGKPVLLCDVGLGVTFSCQQLAGQVPPSIYVSHNHSDHSGELPVVLAVESRIAAAEGRPPPQLYGHPDVMAEVRQYRLRELQSTGKALEDFASYVEVPIHGRTSISNSGLSVQPFRTRHSETCYGLLLYDNDLPVLGWTADSGYDEDLYEHLSAAPVLLVDARADGTAEHAGFDELERLGSLPYMKDKTVYITGYGRQDEAPVNGEVPSYMTVARPGMHIPLGPQLCKDIKC